MDNGRKQLAGKEVQMSLRQVEMSRSALTGTCDWESLNRSFFKWRALGPWQLSPDARTPLRRDEKHSLPVNARTRLQAGERCWRESQSRCGLSVRRLVDSKAVASFKRRTVHECLRRWAQHSVGSASPSRSHQSTRHRVESAGGTCSGSGKRLAGVQQSTSGELDEEGPPGKSPWQR